MSWVIPAAMAYGAAGYLALLWYSDYLKTQEKGSNRRLISLAGSYVDTGSIYGSPREKVDTYLQRC